MDVFEREVRDAFRHYRVTSRDLTRPWGGFLRVDESQAEDFTLEFFGEHCSTGTPKLLLIAPRRRLSLQVHRRRSEVWKVVWGSVGAQVGGKDHLLVQGDTVAVGVNQPHRLYGLEGFALVAEVWVHEDPADPSDEHDIERLQDDHGR